MAVGVDLDYGCGVVGISEVEAEVEQLPSVRDLGYCLPMRENSGTGNAALSQAVDPPVVVVGFFESFNLLNGGRGEEGVVEVGGLEELMVVACEDVVVYPVELVGGVVVDDGLAGGAEHELPPIFECELVGFVHEEDVSLAPPDLLGLVDADELDEVAEEVVGGFGLVVELDVVDVLAFEDFEEVTHDRRPDCGKGLAGDGDDGPGVLVAVAELDESREDGVGLPASRSSLVDLDLGGRVLDVIVCGRLSQLTVESSPVNHDSGFFSATSIS